MSKTPMSTVCPGISWSSQGDLAWRLPRKDADGREADGRLHESLVPPGVRADDPEGGEEGEQHRGRPVLHRLGTDDRQRGERREDEDRGAQWEAAAQEQRQGCQERSDGDCQPRLPRRAEPDLELPQGGERDDEQSKAGWFASSAAVLIMRT